uniref:RING-type E3 ubiquitin transferase n=1 Tax=Cajanus cajan TaxID=3821 RepID=A0A151THQ2_CAJCA|nr:RING finger protein 115 family [Cajanus cajan]
MEESVQGMIPASNEVIQRSLKKSKVTTQGECCPICKELNVDDECYMMPCDHVFHLQCIVSWLQINHVCPVCRYPLPILTT